MIALSDDQQAARDATHAALATGKRCSVMVGPAGSGKTTLMQTVVDDVHATGREVVLLCPTGKAAAVLRDKTGRDASTIHQALYGAVWEEDDEDAEEAGATASEPTLHFGDPHPPCGKGGLVVCDEASMVGSKLHRDMLHQLCRRKGAQLLYVGDREQLEPVQDTWGPDFAAPDAVLTQVHRQALDSPVLQLATAVRTQQPFSGWVPGVCEAAPGDPVAWMAERAQADATLLAYTNKTRQKLNHAVRHAVGLGGALAVGDRVVCLLNSHSTGMMNGEVATVLAIEPAERGWTRLQLSNRVKPLVRLDMLGAKVRDWRDHQKRLPWAQRDEALHVDLGWCLTVHKSQGSEWRSVGFVPDYGYGWLRRSKPDEARRLTYTAVTRASTELRIFK